MADLSARALKAWETRRTLGTIETEVIAHLPLKVDLTKLNSGNDLRFVVKYGKDKLGTLHVGRGSVRWFAKNARKPTGSWTWKEFAKFLGGQ